MIDRIIAFSIERRWLVIALGGLLAVWGLVAALRAPIDAIPDLSENQVIVYADWPGHNPREIDDQVTAPLSVALRGIPGVRVVRASSEVNYGWLSVIFEESVGFGEARARVATRLANLDAGLPPGVAPRLAPDALATGQIFWYTVEGGGLDLGRLRTIQDTFVRGQLASVPGVAEVASVGGMPIEFQVNLDPIRLRALGVPTGDVVRAVEESDAVAGGSVLHKGNAEYVVSARTRLGNSSADPGRFDPAAVLRDLELVPVPLPAGGTIPLRELASVAVGSGPRRGSLEKDGAEVVGGVVLMAHGENPREVTARLKAKVREIAAGLPPGVKIIPFYDRTPLIDAAIGTVTGTLVEAIATASLCVLVVLLHLRTSLVIAATLPLSVLASFALMGLLRDLGIAELPINIMSLAGLVISIGVLADSSIVMAENAMHRLHRRFGDAPVRGDTRAIVLEACRSVGRPIAFSVLIMLLSFLPVFALGGMEGKMFRPLAFAKCFALVAVLALTITLVPALCTVFVRGRLRSERSSPVVRGVLEVYRPVLDSLLDRPAPLLWVLGATLILGLTPVGVRWVSMTALIVAWLAYGLAARGALSRVLGLAGLLTLALAADRWMEPLGRQFIAPLDEQMVMDMPISVPRASITQSTDDVKARDMILCRFPEVNMVVGKAGRAETPTDPAPLDMIETMVGFRPREHWPRRKLAIGDAARQARAIVEALVAREAIAPPEDAGALAQEAMQAVMPRYDALMREYAYQRNLELIRSLPQDPASLALDGPTADTRARWSGHVDILDAELIPRAAETYTRLALEEVLARARPRDPALAAYLDRLSASRHNPVPSRHVHDHGAQVPGGTMSRMAEAPEGLPPQPLIDEIQAGLSASWRGWLILWQKTREDLVGFGGELDRAVPMPGWTNVWTMPIQNRVDMLATGVNTMIGVRVLGRSLDDVVRASEAVAAALKRVPGAADVVTDPIRGKGYVQVKLDRERAAHWGASAEEVARAVEVAIGGTVAAEAAQGRERHPVRVRYARDFREDEEALRRVLVLARNAEGGKPGLIPLAEVADVRIVEGPATVKSENGLLRNYVRLNVRGRGPGDFVAEAREAVARRVPLPEGTFLEWTGQFEHEERARLTLGVILPVVLVLILLCLYATYRDWADALLLLPTIPGAMAGGVFLQWLLGYPFSVTVWVGYIACFGMAASTGIIMLVYLREAVAEAAKAGPLTPERLRAAVLDGAAQRLRPKLLTEGTTILGLAPMLWADGVGSEVIKPMAAPVLGGILIADEVIDLLLPVLFHRIRLRRLEASAAAAPEGGRGDEGEPSSIL